MVRCARTSSQPQLLDHPWWWRWPLHTPRASSGLVATYHRLRRRKECMTALTPYQGRLRPGLPSQEVPPQATLQLHPLHRRLPRDLTPTGSQDGWRRTDARSGIAPDGTACACPWGRHRRPYIRVPRALDEDYAREVRARRRAWWSSTARRTGYATPRKCRGSFAVYAAHPQPTRRPRTAWPCGGGRHNCAGALSPPPDRRRC